MTTLEQPLKFEFLLEVVIVRANGHKCPSVNKYYVRDMSVICPSNVLVPTFIIAIITHQQTLTIILCQSQQAGVRVHDPMAAIC